MSIRKKIKDSQMRLAELASYLGVSRPTLYKYLELYEKKEFNDIDKKVFDLFTFIDNSRNIQRPKLMDYLINKIIPVESTTESNVDIISNVRKLSTSQSEIDLKKMHLIGVLSSSKKMDEIIDALYDLSNTEGKISVASLSKTTRKGEK